MATNNNVTDATKFVVTDKEGRGYALNKGEKGDKGDKGDQGDSFQPIEDVSGLVLAHTLGEDNTKAMSQQGITKAVNDINYIVSSFNLVNGGCYAKYNLNGNKWATNYYSRTYAVVPGRKYVIKAQEEHGAIIGVLKTCYPVGGDVMDFAEGYTTRIVTSPDEEITITMPSDAHYLVVQVTSGSGDITPASVLEYIPRFEYAKSIIPDNTPLAGEAVTSSMMTLVDLTGAIQYSGTYLDGNNKWSNYQSRRSTIYPVTAGTVCRIKANEAYDTNYAFLKSHGQGARNNAELATGSVREAVIHGTIKEVVAPEDANYLYIYRGVTNSDATPEYVKCYKSKVDILEEELYTRGSSEIILEGNGETSVSPVFSFEKGRIIRIDIDNTRWKRTSISSTTAILVCNIDNVKQVNVLAPSTVSYKYYIKTGNSLGFTFRADVGEKVKFTFHDVTDKYQKEVYDIAFVEDTNSMKSMTFKMSMGQKMQYRVLAGNNDEYIKVYSHAVQDDTYKIDSVAAGESSELIIGEYLALRSCYVVVTSNIAIGFTPSCKVLEVGVQDKTVEVKEPYQFIVDTENMVTLLASDDNDATEYDNRVLNGFNILQVEDKWYMWYMGYGSGSLPNILMAYSSDGLNWTRGIPDEIEEPFEGTNVIFKKGVIVGEFAQECVNEFDVLKVNDSQFPFRMICNIRNAAINTVQGECMYMLKSQDGVHWSTVRKMLPTAHDTFMRSIVYGDIIKVYLRMWDYSQASNNNKRMVGVIHCDINGQVIMPPSGLPNMTRGWYGPYAYRIGHDRELMVPTIYYPNTNGINIYESYICSHGELRYAPSYGLESLKKEIDNDGWGAVYSMLYANGKQYLAYEQGPHKHGETGARSEIRVVPIKWVTYNSSNTDSSIQA